MPLDAQAIGRGCAGKITQANQLCGQELERFKQALADGAPVMVACTQEAPLFREVAENFPQAELTFVNIRETGGWSTDAAAAGPKAAVDRCKPLFEAMGPKLWVVGDKPSLANVVKLTGNFLIATVLESLSEAIAFARKSGVDAAGLMDFLTSTLFNAPVYKTYGGLIVQGKYEPAGFALPLGLKDVRLVLQAAESQSVPMPIASVLRDRFLTAMARGNEHSDWSVLGRVAAEDAGLPAAKKAGA